MTTNESLERALIKLVYGVDLYVQTTFSLENVFGPDFIRLRLTAEWLEQRIQQSTVCADVGVDLSIAKETPTYVNESRSEVGPLNWSIHLRRDCFRIVGKSPDGGECETILIEYEEIIDAAALLDDPDSKDMPAGFGSFGGCLFMSNDEDVALFIDDVCDALPEVKARQTALEMATVIEVAAAQAGSDALVGPSAAPVRSRLRTQL